MEKRALRAVYNTTNSPTYQELLNRANMSTLNNRRYSTVMMYKVKNNLSPEYISEVFSRSKYRYDLRNIDYNIPWHNTVKYGKYSLRHYGPYIWPKRYKQDRENPVYSNLGETLGKLTLKVY